MGRRVNPAELDQRILIRIPNPTASYVTDKYGDRVPGPGETPYKDTHYWASVKLFEEGIDQGPIAILPEGSFQIKVREDSFTRTILPKNKIRWRGEWFSIERRYINTQEYSVIWLVAPSEDDTLEGGVPIVTEGGINIVTE